MQQLAIVSCILSLSRSALVPCGPRGEEYIHGGGLSPCIYSSPLAWFPLQRSTIESTVAPLCFAFCIRSSFTPYIIKSHPNRSVSRLAFSSPSSSLVHPYLLCSASALLRDYFTLLTLAPPTLIYSQRWDHATSPICVAAATSGGARGLDSQAI